MYLLDTNACIRFLRDRDSEMARKLASVPRAEVTLCAVVKAELYYGARRSEDPSHSLEVLESFFGSLASLPFDDLAAEAYGRIRAHLAGQGQQIGPNDLLIAAIALAYGATLVTHNTREFARVPDLQVEDWEAGAGG
jgi:tRNA(fMet)-specific endonuclease VapC